MARARTRTRRIAYRRIPYHRKKVAMTIPVATIAGFAPLVSMVYTRGWKNGSDGASGNGLPGVLHQLALRTTGWNGATHSWDGSAMLSGLGPVVLGILVHKIVGGKLGVNRMLGRSGIPLLRI